jgi:hypothetical protein
LLGVLMCAAIAVPFASRLLHALTSNTLSAST